MKINSTSSWNESVLRCFSNMRDDDESADVIFRLIPSQRTFAAHRFVLSATCPFWERVFVDEKERSNDVIEIQGCADGFAAFLDYCYQGQSTVNPTILLKLHMFAHKYEVAGLQTVCETQMLSKLTPETCLEFFNYAAQFSSLDSLQDLREASTAALSCSLADIVETDSLLELSASQLTQLLRNPTMFCSEDVFVAAALRWLAHDDTRLEHARELMWHVRLPMLSKLTLLELQPRLAFLEPSCPGIQKAYTEALHWQLSGGAPSKVISDSKELKEDAPEDLNFPNPRRFSSRTDQHDNGCKFDQGGSQVAISEDKRTVTNTECDWKAVRCTPCSKYSFKIVANSANLMAGFTILGQHTLEDQNYDANTGYYLYLQNGYLYGKGHNGTAYISACHTVGNVITCEWNKEEKSITFYVNGVSKGVAFTGVNEVDLVPALDFYNQGSKIQLCDNPTS